MHGAGGAEQQPEWFIPTGDIISYFAPNMHSRGGLNINCWWQKKEVTSPPARGTREVAAAGQGTFAAATYQSGSPGTHILETEAYKAVPAGRSGATA